MKHRELLLLLGGAMSTRSLQAQQKSMPVNGFLGATSSERAVPLVAFRQRLREIGWVEGQNLAIEYRWAEDHYERLSELAADLVGRKVDVILASGGDASAICGQRRDLDDTDRLHHRRRPGRARPGRQPRAAGW